MDNKGLYIFCLAKGGKEEMLKAEGIGGVPVRALSSRGLMAIVQECEPKPFVSEDQKCLSDWLLIHQKIVDLAWRRYQTIIPMGFDTIIVPANGNSARQNLEAWLEGESEELFMKLGRLQNKAEYGVQISWNPAVFIPRIGEKFPDVKKIEGEIRSKPEGVAYLLQKKLEDLIKQHLESMADAYFKVFYKKVRETVEETHVEKTRKESPPRQMILNVSCLLEKGRTERLGEVLEGIGKIDGFDVRFTGPWPPYSFVNG